MTARAVQGLAANVLHAAAMLDSPIKRIIPIAVLRKVVITCGMFPILTCERSSSKATSRTQCDLFSIAQCPAVFLRLHFPLLSWLSHKRSRPFASHSSSSAGYNPPRITKGLQHAPTGRAFLFDFSKQRLSNACPTRATINGTIELNCPVRCFPSFIPLQNQNGSIGQK